LRPNEPRAPRKAFCVLEGLGNAVALPCMKAHSHGRQRPFQRREAPALIRLDPSVETLLSEGGRFMAFSPASGEKGCQRKNRNSGLNAARLVLELAAGAWSQKTVALGLFPHCFWARGWVWGLRATGSFFRAQIRRHAGRAAQRVPSVRYGGGTAVARSLAFPAPNAKWLAPSVSRRSACSRQTIEDHELALSHFELFRFIQMNSVNSGVRASLPAMANLRPFSISFFRRRAQFFALFQRQRPIQDEHRSDGRRKRFLVAWRRANAQRPTRSGVDGRAPEAQKQKPHRLIRRRTAQRSWRQAKKRRCFRGARGGRHRGKRKSREEQRPCPPIARAGKARDSRNRTENVGWARIRKG